MVCGCVHEATLSTMPTRFQQLTVNFQLDCPCGISQKKEHDCPKVSHSLSGVVGFKLGEVNITLALSWPPTFEWITSMGLW